MLFLQTIKSLLYLNHYTSTQLCTLIGRAFFGLTGFWCVCVCDFCVRRKQERWVRGGSCGVSKVDPIIPPTVHPGTSLADETIYLFVNKTWLGYKWFIIFFLVFVSHLCHMINIVFVFVFVLFCFVLFVTDKLYGRGVTLHVHWVPHCTALYIIFN